MENLEYTIAQYIFEEFNLKDFEKYPIKSIDIEVDQTTEKIKLFGFKVNGFKFIFANTSKLNEEDLYELRIFIQFENNNPYGIVYDNGSFKPFVEKQGTWVHANILAISGLLMALEQLKNSIFGPEKLEELNEELIRNFIINAY
jgi:hypothetical protein